MRSYRIEEASAYFAQATSRSSPSKTLVMRKTREIQQSRLGLRCSLLMDPGFRPGCSVVVVIAGLIAGADVIDMDAGLALCFEGEVPPSVQVARCQHRWRVVHPNALRPWRAGTISEFIALDPSEVSTNAGCSAGLLTARCQLCWRDASLNQPCAGPRRRQSTRRVGDRTRAREAPLCPLSAPGNACGPPSKGHVHHLSPDQGPSLPAAAGLSN